jgi:ABC-2 type transport system permease protein
VRSALDLYRRLIAIQIRAQLQYPVAFWFGLITTGLYTTFAFGSLALLLQRFEGIGGWTLAEVAFLYGMVEMAFGMMDMVFSGFDPPFFGRLVRLGQFDQLLLRPANITLQMFGSRLELRRLSRIAQGVIILGAALALTEIRWTPIKIGLLPVVFISLVSFFGGLFVIGATITFWTVESIEMMNILTYGGSEMMAYPMHIYWDWMRRFFTFVVPGIFLNYYPALYILGKPDPLHMPTFAPLLAPVVGLGTLAVALAFWRFGIRHYTSTGS